MIKNALKLVREWSDIIILAPISFLLLVAAYFGLRYIDPTCAIMDMGVLQILFLNVLTYLTVNFLAYFTYKINFTDYFQKNWGFSLNPHYKLGANILLWTFQLATAAYILTRNL